MSYHSGYIADGYTETGYVAAVPGIHQAVRLTYRPMLQSERRRLINENNAFTQQSKSDLAVKNTCNIMALKIKSWDLTYKGKDGEEKPVPVTADDIGRLKGNLFERALGILMGTDGGDLDPDAAPEAAQKTLAQELEALEKQQAVGDVKAAADLGNS